MVAVTASAGAIDRRELVCGAFPVVVRDDVVEQRLQLELAPWRSRCARSITPELSVARSRSRRSSSSTGAVTKIVTAPGTRSDDPERTVGLELEQRRLALPRAGGRSRSAASRSGSRRSRPTRGTPPLRCAGRTPRGRETSSATPSCSPGRCGRVVAETASASSGKRGRTSWISVPLPAPDGPVTTKTGVAAREDVLAPVEEGNQLVTLAVGETADRLRLADAALVEQARRLHAAELRDRHRACRRPSRSRRTRAGRRGSARSTPRRTSGPSSAAHA